MKYISLLILLLSVVLPSDTSAATADSLVYRLKLAEAYELGLDKTLDFQLMHGRHKEQAYLDALHEIEDISPLFTSTTSVCDTKSYLIRQLFIPVGQRISNQEDIRVTQFADSLFESYLAKPSESYFKEIIKKFSADKKIHWVNELEETTEFHQVVSQLKHLEISRPFLTPKGIHIVQKLDEADQLEVVKEADVDAVDEIMLRFGIFADKDAFKQIERQGHTDLALVYSEYNSFNQEDFQRFSLGNTSKGGELLQQEFLKYSLVKDLKSRLNQDPSFTSKLSALFEEDLYKRIYDVAVIRPVQHDSLGLEQFFDEHKENYRWSKPKFQGLLVFCKNSKIRKELHSLLSSAPLKDWIKIIEIFNKEKEQISYEMGTFEEGDNPTIDSFIFKKGKKRKFKRKGFPKTQVYGEVIAGPKFLENGVRDAVFADYLKYKEAEWEKYLLSKYKAGKYSPNSLKSVNNQTSN